MDQERTSATLTIGELAARTGVAAGTLRTWETRYGLPSPIREPSGHRRYHSDDVALVLETVRHRASGLSMPRAIEHARSHAQRAEQSVFAGLRRRHPELRVQVLGKPAMLALCRAIEDECCAQADRPLLFATFQRTQFYSASRRRWQELSRTAHGALVFADFAPPTSAGPATSGARQGAGPLPVEVPVPVDSPINREWSLVCDSSEYPGCVVGWERPGDPEDGDRGRVFETLWSVEPLVVRDAARICAQLSEDFLPGSPFPHWDMLEGAPPRASAETRRASGVLDRMLQYLSRAYGPGDREGA